MYYEHFGLREPPFRITPDTSRFYAGGDRGAILDAIVYAITSGEGIVKVVGEVGSGKTMLCRMLEVRLPRTVEVVYLANPNLTPDNILHAIAFEMGLQVTEHTSRFQVVHALQQHLLSKHAEDRQVVVFIEEAQSMPLETLEEVRLLSNLETQRYKLLQLVLFGQPELEPNLSAPHIRQLRERITHSFELPPLGRGEIGKYLDFRMRAAGYRGPEVFTPAAVRRLAKESAGLVRRANILADKALLAAYAANRHQVTPKEVKVALADSEFRRRPGSWRLAGTAASVGLVAVGGIAAWLMLAGGTVGGAALPWPAPPATTGSAATAEQAAVAAAPEGEREAPGAPPEAAAARAQSAPGPGSGPESSPAHAPGPDATIAGESPAAEGTPAGAPGEDPDEDPGRIAVATSPAAPAASTPRLATPARTAPERGPEPAPEPPVAAPAPEAADAAPGDAETFYERRLAATREWMRSARPEAYSIQLMLVSARRVGDLHGNLMDAGLGGQLDDIYLYHTRIRGDELVSVLLGTYDREDRARKVLTGLPPAMQASRPFLRRVGDVQSDWSESTLARAGG